MRFYVPQCRYCKTKKNDCKSYYAIKQFFKNSFSIEIKSANIKCNDFIPIAKVGDVIEFEMCGNILKRPVFYIDSKFKTFIVLTARNKKNKELFTNTIYDYRGDEHYKKYYIEDEQYNINNNLMLGFVNYKFIKRIIKNVDIPSMNWENNIDYSKLDFLSNKDL